MELDCSMVTAAFSAEITGGGCLDCGPKIDPFCLGLPLGVPSFLPWPPCVMDCPIGPLGCPVNSLCLAYPQVLASIASAKFAAVDAWTLS